VKQTWVALLRGINLVKRNRIAMPELRRALEEAGYRDVRTYIASGNVVFRKQAADRKRLARALERLIEEQFGVRAAVVLRTPEELRRIVDAHPFGRDTSKTHVAFLAEKPPAKAVKAVAKLDVAPDRIEVRGTEVYLRHPNGYANARVKRTMLEPLGVATDRNWRTVERLVALATDD
jgi:uncharacterized protein (DUF1697 family)